MSTADADTFAAAERTARILAAAGVPVALIGAGALAVHGYARATEDLDLAVATDPFSTLRTLRATLATELGCDAVLLTPDADDPLGGVLTLTSEMFATIQIVNFFNPLAGGTNPGAEAITTAANLIAGASLRVVDLPHLVALKLYAGGRKSELDVLELLACNPATDVADLEAVCARFGLAAELARVLANR